MKPFLKFLLILALSILDGVAYGATYTNSVNTLPIAQSNVDRCIPGDTVYFQAGSNTWAGALTVTNGIQLIGAGTNQTIIVDGGANATQLIAWNCPSNTFPRLSGFTFQGNGNGILYSGSIIVGGTCHAFRIDHCEFKLLKQYAVWVGDWVYGVIDHCTFTTAGTMGIEVKHSAYGGYNYGDGSWAGPDDWGTTNALYVEDCSFTGDSGPGLCAVDAADGARFVVRYCNITNTIIGSHGTESSGRERSVRLIEAYENVLCWVTNGADSHSSFPVYFRGGTGVVFSNLFVGGFQYVVAMGAYREWNSPWPFWGNVYPGNGWDTNYATTFDAGHATASTGATLTDTGKSWTINQWVGYFVFNTNAANSFAITANTATTITTESGYHDISGGVGANASFTTGDGYQIHFVRAVLDQPGTGQGDLVSGDTPLNSTTGTAIWPHETFDPIYQWGNTLNYQYPDAYYGAPVNGGISQSYVVVSGRDWIDGTPKPGYTPLVYPHPLVSGISLPVTSVPFYLNVRRVP